MMQICPSNNSSLSIYQWKKEILSIVRQSVSHIWQGHQHQVCTSTSGKASRFSVPKRLFLCVIIQTCILEYTRQNREQIIIVMLWRDRIGVGSCGIVLQWSSNQYNFKLGSWDQEVQEVSLSRGTYSSLMPLYCTVRVHRLSCVLVLPVLLVVILLFWSIHHHSLWWSLVFVNH